MSTFNPYEVEYIQYCSGGAYECYPMIKGQNSTWNKRNEAPYKILEGQRHKWDLITTADFKEGDWIIPGINVVLGDDRMANEKFKVVRNGATATYFNAGTVPSKDTFVYVGTRPADKAE